jgi:MoaA/NifB/PqqE/SkfB family radical SAM enzyme
MTMPGSSGVALKPHGIGQPVGPPGGHPSDLNAMMKGRLAGTGVGFISHEGDVYPCGDLPVVAGDLRKQTLSDLWSTRRCSTNSATPAN